MHTELKNVLVLFRAKRHPIEIQKTPEVYINGNSPASEVRAWLQAKAFSASVVNTLGDMDGVDLFSLTKEQLEAICGVAEGRRLHSQITISRNVTGVSDCLYEFESRIKWLKISIFDLKIY